MAAPTLLDPPADETTPPARTGVQIMGDPLPWPRAGAQVKPGRDPHTVKGVSPHDLFKAGWVWQPWINFYMPAEEAHRCDQIEAIWKAAGLPFFEKERLVFRAEFIFARPSGHFGTGKNAGTVKPQFMDARPGGRGNKNADGLRTGGDIDNLCKLVLDALNKVAFADDGQIARIEAEKCFVDQADADRPQTIFDLLPLDASRSVFSGP